MTRRYAMQSGLTDRSGAAVVEFAIMLPLFVLIVFGIIQFGFVFFIWNDMTNAAREGTRRLSVDDTVTEAQAATIVQSWLIAWPATFDVTACKIAAQTTNPTDCTGADSVSVTVSAPMNQVSIVGPIAVAFGLSEMRASVTMRKEAAP